LEGELHARPLVCRQRLAELDPGRVLLGQGGVVGLAVPLQDLALPAQPQVGAAGAVRVLDGEEGHALDGERGAGADPDAELGEVVHKLVLIQVHADEGGVALTRGAVHAHGLGAVVGDLVVDGDGARARAVAGLDAPFTRGFGAGLVLEVPAAEGGGVVGGAGGGLGGAGSG
jgi:hypothetical protein